MKKLLFACIFFAGCTSNEKDLLSKAETYLKTQLKDPASYQPISSKITDTTMLKEDLTYNVSIDSLDVIGAVLAIERDSLGKISDSFLGIEHYSKAERLQNDLKNSKTKMESSIDRLNKLKTDSVHSVEMLFEYRAKNGMGALDINKSRVDYFPSENRFSVSEIK